MLKGMLFSETAQSNQEQVLDLPMDSSLDTGLMDWLNRPCPLVIDELDPVQVNAFAGAQFKGRVHVVRLDKTHPIISGNKWFKLKYRLKSLIEQSVQQLVSFGGPYSNHLHALGYAAKTFGFSMTAIIRGEAVTNPMITDLHSWGVECRFVNRQTYRALCLASGDFSYEGVTGFAIPEGGADPLSLKGCAEIMTAIKYWPLMPNKTPSATGCLSKL
jgi:1-aminocyclopropane-1-carboxylate deaminase/D-cysteine desulfhydrase-like pyridoxal-dependent ACC family enzyme